MKFKGYIKTYGRVVITKITEDGKKEYFYNNKINNKMKIALGELICAQPVAPKYIYAINVYGLVNQAEINSKVRAATPEDNFPAIPADRDGVITKTGASLSIVPNIISGVNLFSTTISSNDNLGSNTTYYITDAILVGKNNGNYEVWARVTLPTDGNIGLYKTPSVIYKIDWYIIFNQE
jgi:hypothetical protein